MLFYKAQQNEFLIGAFSPPNIKIGLTPCPGDYNGDGLADLAVKTDGGYWLIDYADKNDELTRGFNGWEPPYYELNYTDSTGNHILIDGTAHPAPADYDGDGTTDISIKTDDGKWLIDYSTNGFGGWDLILNDQRGDATAHPVPADYNGDGLADLAVKTDDGYWLIDYAVKDANNNIFFNGWQPPFYQIYGDATSHPVPADYDGDGFADLAVKTDDGKWKIDLATTGFGMWDIILSDKGGADAHPVPADYNGDGYVDLAVKTDIDGGKWLIDFADINANNFGFIDGWEPTIYSGYGDASTIPVPADYDGDKKADLSLFTNDSFRWLIDPSNDDEIFGKAWRYLCNMGAYTNYEHLGINPLDQLAFRKVKQANIDFLVNPPVMNATENPKDNFSKIDYYLKIASLESLKIMISSHHIIGFQNPENTFAQNIDFVNHFKNEIPQNLSNAILGVYLGDEPKADVTFNFSNIKKWTDFFKDKYPEKPTFYNLLPRYGVFVDNADYENYLNSYINTNSTSFVSVDHYPFMKHETFYKSFFYNLYQLKQKSGTKPFWFVVNTNKNEAPVPFEPKLRFTNFSAIAYGATGILYWEYMNGFGETDNLNNLIYLNNYNAIKKINNYIKKVVGPVVVNNKIVATLHKNNTSLNDTYPFSSSELISNNNTIVRDVNNDHILVGIFESEKINNAKTSYIWVVNKNSDSTITNNKIYLKGQCKGNIYISQRIDTYNSNLDSFSPIINTYFDAQKNWTVVTIPELTAGEGIMLKVVRKVIKYRDYDGDGKSDRSLKTNTGEWKIDFKSNGFSSTWDVVYSQYGNAEAHGVPADYNGDGITDLSVKTDWGDWLINFYDAQGNGGWDLHLNDQRGDATCHPVPADYNGDGLDDLAVKTDDGRWYIDFAVDGTYHNGYGIWDIQLNDQRGNATCHPVPADYNGDGLADLAVQTDNGNWFIDFAEQGANNNGYGVWDVMLYSRWNGPAQAAQADYDGDGLVDISVKTDNDGTWYIDYAGNGFGTWDLIIDNQRGGAGAHPVPADYDGDGMADLSVKTDDGRWFIDYAEDGYVKWDEIIETDNGDAGSIALRQTKDNLVTTNSLENIPNPFNTSTVIKFNLIDKPKNLEFIINNSNGEIVDKITLTSKNMEDGYFYYNALSLPVGLFYYYLISDGKIIQSNKMVKN
ncbi:MAG: hypothetical protein BGO86_00780 [Chryseobacterium sp. 36-9]|nr:MAG: hypothetical protein BGO86_00780 [Chryseobacterium sp. 36-9]